MVLSNAEQVPLLLIRQILIHLRCLRVFAESLLLSKNLADPAETPRLAHRSSFLLNCFETLAYYWR